MKLCTNVDWDLLRNPVERHYSMTTITEDIVDQRSLDDKRRNAFRVDFFRFRSLLYPQKCGKSMKLGMSVDQGGHRYRQTERHPVRP
jgi:hypothetical protein